MTREAVLLGRHLRHDRYSHRPDFLIVGVQKAGTTALFEELTALPRVGTPLVKETHYFDAHRSRQSHWYRNHFWGDDRLHPKLWGEATPAYFDVPELPAQIVHELPDVKIVLTLRDPLARAISHYFHAVDFGWEDRSIHDAFAEELALLRRDGVWDERGAFLTRGYLARSCYTRPMQRWLDLVPREQICVVVSEQRVDALREVGAFLGVLDEYVESSALREANRRPYEIPADLEAGPVADLFRADTERLQGLLGWLALPSEWLSVTESL